MENRYYAELGLLFNLIRTKHRFFSNCYIAMITVELKYPLNRDVKEFGVPLPNIFIDSGDYVAFLFTDENEYYEYLGSLCDLIDNLFYEAAKTEQTRNKLTCLYSR